MILTGSNKPKKVLKKLILVKILRGVFLKFLFPKYPPQYFH
jgi:hypothetical protein